MLEVEVLHKNPPFMCYITNDEYHNSIGISNSAVKLLLDCPARYYSKYIAKTAPDLSTPSTLLGNLMHTTILEPHLFDERYLVVEKINRNAKAYKKIVEDNPDKEIIFTEDYQIAKKMIASVRRHPVAKYILEDGIREHSIFWRDPDTNVICKSRPDYINYQYKFVFDLKTTACSEPEMFKRTISNYYYHTQAAMALDGIAAINGEPMDAVTTGNGEMTSPFFNVCVETVEPYIVTVFSLSMAAIEEGRALYKKALQIYNNCLLNERWPAYSDSPIVIDLPRWAKKSYDIETELEGVIYA